MILSNINLLNSYSLSILAYIFLLGSGSGGGCNNNNYNPNPVHVDPVVEEINFILNFDPSSTVGCFINNGTPLDVTIDIYYMNFVVES